MEKIRYCINTPCKYCSGVAVSSWHCKKCQYYHGEHIHMGLGKLDYVRCSCVRDHKRRKFMNSIFRFLRRIQWFINGRLARHLYVKRSIRPYWRVFWVSLSVILILAYIVSPLVILWMKGVGFINYVVWGI